MAGMTTAQKIRATRKKLGWSQAELATACGYLQEQISGWERERTKPSGEQIWALAAALKVSTDFLLDPNANELPPLPMTERQKLVWQIAADLGWDATYRRLIDAGRSAPIVSTSVVERGRRQDDEAIGGNPSAKP